MAREGRRDPRVLVGPVPDGDTDAAIDGHTRTDDSVVVGLLLLEELRSRGEGHADVELGDRHLDALRSELCPVGREALRKLADDKVALEANTIERNAGGLEALDEIEHCSGLGARAFNVVVVDVELRVGVGCPSGVQSNLNVLSAEGVVEHIGTPSSIIVERL